MIYSINIFRTLSHSPSSVSRSKSPLKCWTNVWIRTAECRIVSSDLRVFIGDGKQKLDAKRWIHGVKRTSMFAHYQTQSDLSTSGLTPMYFFHLPIDEKVQSSSNGCVFGFDTTSKTACQYRCGQTFSVDGVFLCSARNVLCITFHSFIDVHRGPKRGNERKTSVCQAYFDVSYEEHEWSCHVYFVMVIVIIRANDAFHCPSVTCWLLTEDKDNCLLRVPDNVEYILLFHFLANHSCAPQSSSISNRSNTTFTAASTWECCLREIFPHFLICQ